MVTFNKAGRQLKTGMSEKKYVLITGATGGRGEAAARYLYGQGYGLVLVGRNESKLDKFRQELTPDTFCVSYDLNDLHNIESVFGYISDNGIKLDGMVHAAGINRDTAIRMNDVDVMQEVTAVNYMSFVELMKLFVKKKYSNDGGSVVAISSSAVMFHPMAMCTYAASKAALESAVIVAAKESAKRGIRVNAIRPGFVDTKMAADAPSATAERIEEEHPLGLIDPIHIAYMIEYLLSDKAKYITGAMIPVTGGAC